MNPFEKLDAAIEETTAPASPLDAAIQEVSSEEKDNRRRALLGASERSPEEIVEARRVGKVLNLPAAAVVHDLPGLKKRARLEEIDAAIEGAPVLARKLGEPEFAGLAQDDTETSKRVEQAANFKPTINGADVSMLVDEALKRNPALDWDTARSNVLNKYNVDNLATGLLRTPQRPTLTPESFVQGLLLGAKNLIPKMREQARMQFAGNLGLQEMEADAQRRYEQFASRESLASPEFERGDTLARYAYGGAQSVLTNVPGLTLAVLTKNPYVALVPAVTQTELDQYARTRARGGSVGEANLAGALSGVVEGATELYPMKFLVDSIGKRTLMQLVVGDQIREQFGEQIATHMQDAIDTAIANPTKTWGEYWKERPDAAAQTVVAVLMQSAVVATTGYAANSMAGKNDAAIKADQYAQSFLKLAQLAEASKIRSRDPESFQQYLAEVADEGPVQDVWVSPNTLMQSGVDVQALAQLSPSFAEQLDDALQRNGEVRIPVAEFATALPGTGFEQAILPHLRTDPDAMTQSEAQVFMQSQAEEFQREAETVLAKVEERSTFDTSAQVVEDSILSQLKTANRFTEDVNREYAKVARAVFSSAAARMNVTPEEAYKKFALQIRAQQIAAQYDQKTGQLKTETPEFKAWFGDSKVVDARGRPLVVYHGTASDVAAFDPARRPDRRSFLSKARDVLARGGLLPSRSASKAKGLGGELFGNLLLKAEHAYGGPLPPLDALDAGSMFFTTNRNLANEYVVATTATGGLKTTEDTGGNVIPVHLRLQRPITIVHTATAERYGADMVLPSGETIDLGNVSNSWAFLNRIALAFAKKYNADGVIIKGAFDSPVPKPMARMHTAEGVETSDIYIAFSPTQIKSVFNRGTFDPNDPNILNQSPLEGMTEEEQGVTLADWLFGNRPPFATAKRVRELGELLVEMSPKAHADFSDENKAFIAGVMVKELDAAFKSGKAVTDWYEHNIQQMHDIVALEFPEIATDQEARFAFDYILAVLSNGQKVPDNFKNAMRYYERYRTEKRMPSIDSTYGVRHNQMAQAFQLYNIAKNEIGAETFREFMLTKHPVITMNGMRTSPVRELVDQELYGGTIIGSKIGGAFLQNISGNHDALTMDTWWMRTWGRLSGTLLAEKYDPNDKNDTGLNDATSSGAHKAFMRETAEEALSQLRKLGYPDLQMDGLQATYWYMEKELYAINGNADADVEGTDYGTEAAKHAAARGYADHTRVVEILRDANQPLGRGGRGADGRARESGRADQISNQGPTVTEEAQALVDQHTPELIEEYFARFGNVIDPDNVKQLFPAYAANPALAAAVHEPSSQLAKAIFTEALRRNQGAPVVFTAGGGGSGKTEAMSVTQALLGGPEAGGLIYDSTLSSFESAVRRIDEALASGSEVDIVYTNRRVEDAFIFAMGRARVVPVPVLAQAHVGASNTIRQLAGHYAGNLRVQIQVVNNLGGVDDINLGSLADVPTYEYNDVERRLHELARGALEAGRIGEERYAALTAPVGRTPGESAGGVQGGEQGQDLGGLVEGLGALFQSSAQQPTVSSSKVTSLDEFDTNMPAFLRKDGWIVITATTSGDPYSEANVAANRVLEEDLKARGLPYRAGEGFYLKEPQGASFLVQGDEALGIELAKKYHQESVLTKDGYVYQDGSLTPVDHTKDTFGDEAKQQDGYTTIGDKTFSLGLDFSQRVHPMDRPQPSLPFAVHGIKAVHYSKAERKTLDGHRFGEGLTGAERERLRDADPRLRVRTAFYVSNGRGVFPEAGVGTVAHLSTLNNLYDADADPLHLWDKHRDANARELAVIEAGYAGYLGRDTFDRQGTVVVFGRSDLKTSKVENADAVAEVPPLPNISEVQRVRRAFAIDKRFPAGQMSRASWGEYARTIESSYYDKLAPFGVFEGEEVVYRDELLRGAYDQTPAAPRGQFEPSTNTITLLQQADLTTFIHELGHFQLEVLASMAAQGEASAQGDMQTLLGWFGVPDLATWQGLSLEEKRPYHEQFARGFEAYTLEGKAPSIELRGAFARIRAWMLNIYKELSLRVQLTDEVRGVFDRMLATEQQIAESETQRGYAALFESAEAAGMTPEEWAEYQTLGAQATEDATAELQARSVRNMRWISNAKSRALKALQKDATAKRKAVEAEVREEVRRQPVYAARRFLAYGELGPEVLFGKGEELTGKLDLPALKAMYGEGPAAPWRYLPTGENGLAASEGLHPDVVAEMFGFTSGDHMVRELIGAEQEAVVVEGMTDQRMLERYGDLTTPEGIERAAEKAIHNEARTKFIATELNALARATGQRKVLVPAAKEFADRTVARQSIRLLKPTQYAAAEARAGRAAIAALKAGNTTEAAVEKRNQLVNSLAAKAATEAAADIEGGVTYLKKFDREGTRKKIDIEYLDQIDAILERFDLRTGQSLTAIDKRKSLASWIAKQEAMGLEPSIPDSLRNEAFRKHYKDLTVEEFRGLIDSVRNIEHLGRLKTKLLTAVRQREFAAAVEEIVTSIEANAKGTAPERRSSDRGRLVDVGQLARSFLADHRKFASLAREMDGWQDGGVMWEYLVRGMNAAGDKEASMREAATVKLSELLKPILKTGGMGKKTYFPQIGKSFTREERIGIALNMGNEVNRERVMSGEKLGPVQLQAILDTLTPEEGDFVQAVWTFFESYRPQIAEKQRRLTGTEPEWVQPTQVFLGGKYREGGYYPIAYDPLRSSRAEADTAAEVQRQIERGLYVQAQTRRGHLKARTDSTGRPLRYDLGVIVKHVDQVVHDLAWHEFLIDANRLLRNGRIDGAIREHYGPEKLATMKDTLRDIAIGDMAAQGSLDRILNHLRHGATIVGLGWRVTTSLLQPLGLTQSMVRIGPQWVAKGARHWMGDTVSLENSARLIGEKSTFMRLRSKTLQREINEIRNKVRGKDSVMEASYFYLIQKMQLVADIPTWWGAYEKAMSTEENEARAIALADQAVLDAQGSGQIKDLSAVQRGGAGWKLFTTFYSFFNTTYQNTVEAVGRTNFKSPASIGLLGVDLLLLYTIPAMLGTLMKVGLSGDWEDEDKLLRRLLADQVSYLTGTMMLVREGGGIAQNLIDPQHAFDYTGPASLRFFASVSNLAKQVGQGEADEPFWKSLNEVLGTVFHYPAGQINATVDGINSMADGKTENPGALIVGHRDR